MVWIMKQSLQSPNRIDFKCDQHSGTAHTVDLTYLVDKNYPRWRKICTVTQRTNGDVQNFFKEFKRNTNAAESSKWDKTYMK